MQGQENGWGLREVRYKGTTFPVRMVKPQIGPSISMCRSNFGNLGAWAGQKIPSFRRLKINPCKVHETDGFCNPLDMGLTPEASHVWRHAGPSPPSQGTNPRTSKKPGVVLALSGLKHSLCGLILRTRRASDVALIQRAYRVPIMAAHTGGLPQVGQPFGQAVGGV
jgi:hypothetical protein